MKRLITLDTNILRKLKYLENMKTEIDKLTQFGEVFIPEVVLDELSFYFRATLKEKIVDNVSTLAALKISIDEDTLNTEITDMNRIRKHISSLFNNNVISRDSVNIDELYKRALEKLPPFLSKKESDQGIKDCILWLSIIEKDFTDFDQVVFITADGGFSTQFDYLSDEFYKRHEIEILRFSEILQFETHFSRTSNNTSSGTVSIKETTDQKSNSSISKIVDDYRTMAQYRDSIDKLVNKTFYAEVGGYYNLEYVPCFKIYEKMSIPTLDSLIDQISKVISEYIGRKNVKPFELFKRFVSVENFHNSYMLDLDDLVDLLELLENIRNDVPQYAQSFLNSIVSVFNDDFFEINSFELDNLELPF